MCRIATELGEIGAEEELAVLDLRRGFRQGGDGERRRCIVRRKGACCDVVLKELFVHNVYNGGD